MNMYQTDVGTWKCKICSIYVKQQKRNELGE